MMLCKIIVSVGSRRSEMQLFTAQQVSHNFDTLNWKWGKGPVAEGALNN